MSTTSQSSCSVDGCTRKHQAKGFCNTHYLRNLRHGTTDMAPPPTPVQRFWNKVDILTADECWLWRGGLTRAGYGVFTIWGEKTAYAHRRAYELVKGAIPAGLVVMHSCDVPACCNPAHLSAGTDADNVHDAITKGRADMSGLAIRWRRGKGIRSA